MTFPAAGIPYQFDERDPSAQRIAELLTNEKRLITPLAYIRGRSLHRAHPIVDEAQNLTPHEVKFRPPIHEGRS